MNWVSFFIAIIQLAREIIQYAASKNADKNHAVDAVILMIKHAKQEVSDAHAAQDNLNIALGLHPDRLRANDGFKRDDGFKQP